MQPRLKVAIHQPNLLPRLKVLQKLADADIWCVLDSVQYNSREWQNRARIVAVHGRNQTFWLSIPVYRPHRRDTLINEASIVNPSLTERIIELTLLHAFRCAPYWDSIDDLLAFLKPQFATDTLVKLCVDITCSLLRIADRQPTVLYASSMPVTGKGSNLIAAICKYLNAASYLTDSGSSNYLQPVHFKKLEVVWQDWHEPEEEWPGISSWRDISSINYLARVGPDQFTQHLLNGKFIHKTNFGTSSLNSILIKGDQRG